MTQMFAHAIERQIADEPHMAAYMASVAAIPGNASYRILDSYEMAMAKSEPADPEAGREGFELQMHHLRWRVAGRNTFLIGPQTAARIAERVRQGDVPTAPVPPAYIEFEEAPVNFAASKPLRAAFISRGVVGRITFLADGPHEGVVQDGGSATVLLPSVFSDRHLDNLKRAPAAAKPSRPDAAASSLAQIMAQNIGGLDTAAINGMAAHLGMLGDVANGGGEPSIDMSAMLIDRAFGPLTTRPNPLLPKAARFILVAADEARRSDPTYAQPRYLNENQVERNWMESGDMPVKLRDDVVRLA